MSKNFEKYEKLFEKGDKINFDSFAKIDKILNNVKKEDYVYTVLDDNTIEIKLASSNKKSVTAKGFFLFRVIEFKDKYEVLLDLNFKKSVKSKLDGINRLTDGKSKVWGIQHSENKKHWGYSWDKKYMDSEKIHKIVYHFILPLIAEMKYKTYVHFNLEEQGHYMTDYFIVTKLS